MARRRRLLAIMVLLVAGVIGGPSLIAATPLRNLVLGRVLAGTGWQVSASGASFGWWSPLELRGLRVRGQSPPLEGTIERMRFDHSWWSLWGRSPDVGQVRVESPRLEVRLDEPSVPPRRRSSTTGTFHVTGLALQVVARDADGPILDVDGLDLVARIESASPGRNLIVEPVQLLDSAPLSPELFDRGLQLVAPPLAHTTSVSGRGSLRLNGCRIPLDSPDPAALARESELSGSLALHEVSTSLKDSAVRDVARLATQLLRVELPQLLRIADETTVQFELRDGRVYQDGLTFLLPELSPDMRWQLFGSVGLDETLDLTIQAQVPFTLLGDNPLVRRLTESPIEVRLAGTMDAPQLALPPDRPWLRDAARIVLEEGLPAETPPLAEAAIDLLQQLRERAAENRAAGEPTVVDRLRERLQQRGKARARDAAHDPAAPPGDN